MEVEPQLRGAAAAAPGQQRPARQPARVQARAARHVAERARVELPALRGKEGGGRGFIVYYYCVAHLRYRSSPSAGGMEEGFVLRTGFVDLHYV